MTPDEIARLITDDPDVLVERGPDERAKLHAKITREGRDEKEKAIIWLIFNHLTQGETEISRLLENGTIKMEQLSDGDDPGIIDAIKAKRCLAGPDQDFGHTYLKNIVGNAIRAEFPKNTRKFGVISVNDARKTMGLTPTQHKGKEALY